MRFFPSIATSLIVALLTACGESSLPSLPSIPKPSVPFVHKIDIQQGNVVTQEMVAQLRLGMDKKKVRFIMGTPIIQDTFHAKRWDYIYMYHEGGGGTERRLVTVVFNDAGNLVELSGDVKAALGRLEVDKHQDTSVKVPYEYEKPLMAKIKDSMPFTGGDDEEESDPESSSDDEASDDTDAELLAEVDDDSVTVPAGAPPKKKKGFFARIVDSVGLGADEDEIDEEEAFDPGDPKYRDVTDPENQ